jgi:hypothetical protein
MSEPTPTTAPMTDEIRRLWTLATLDEQIVVIDGHLARFPAEREALDQRVAAERARVAAHQQAVAELQKRRRELEREIEALTEQERKYLGQQAAVKTNAEYQALTHEIDGCKQKRSDRETDVLMLMDEQEAQARTGPQIDAALRAAEAERAERVRALEAVEAEERAQRAELAAKRAAELDGLPPATRSRYERVHSSRQGRAVVLILKGACGGCFRTQSPAVLQEARKRDRLIACDGCGRILILAPDGA